MTIKELETILEVPRATIRFYEKEGLISPSREENGYRDYSDSDVEKLKKIIVLRKIGLSVNSISDLFDGVKTLPEELNENMDNLQKQIDELQGAMNLCRRMKESETEITSMNADRYWNLVEEEEKQGNKFMTIAKDIVQTEKGVLASYFAFTSESGEPYCSWPGVLRNAIICMGIAGCVFCLMRGTWNVTNFVHGIIGILCIIAVEAVLSIPLYFLSKKYPGIKKHRNAALIISALALALILLIVGNLFGV